MTPTSEKEIYSAFAVIYDTVMRDVDYDSWARHIIRLAKKFRLPRSKLLEIACGTGTLSLRLTQLGCDVTGVDLSGDMLKLAREKLRAEDVDLPLYQASMDNLSSLDLEPVFDLVTCLYDSLNYLLHEEAVLRSFHDVYELLRPGGGYIFDVTTEYNLLHNFAGYTFAENFDDVSYIWENEYDILEKICSSKVSMFRLEDSGYQKYVEVHRQKVYSTAWLKQSLNAVGFEVLGTFYNMTDKPVKAKCERIHFVCKKPK